MSFRILSHTQRRDGNVLGFATCHQKPQWPAICSAWNAAMAAAGDICHHLTRADQPGIPIPASNDLMPFQVIPTPMHTMMKAESRTTTDMAVCPIRLPTRWA